MIGPVMVVPSEKRTVPLSTFATRVWDGEKSSAVTVSLPRKEEVNRSFVSVAVNVIVLGCASTTPDVVFIACAVNESAPS